MGQIVAMATDLHGPPTGGRRQGPPGEILQQLYALSDQACTRAERQVLRAHRLDMRAWMVLKAIGQLETATQREIASATALDKVAVNRATSWLKNHGLVNTFPNSLDGRSHLLELSFAGQRTLAECMREIEELEKELLTGLSENEHWELTKLLKHLRRSLAFG